jgi:hypothetical protein
VFFRRAGNGERPRLEDVQGYFETFWTLETQHQPMRYGERETKESLLGLGRRMLAVLCEQYDSYGEIIAVEQSFSVSLINQGTDEVLEHGLVGTWDLLEQDAEGFVVVDLKTAARKPRCSCRSTTMGSR